NEAVRIDGVILTKLDADARGGAALSISHAIGAPILFVGVGQGYDDLKPFDEKWFVDRIFGEE
ncbi:MAG: signal recognition particle-docking protein FtsY, partial [Thermococcus sp.]